MLTRRSPDYLAQQAARSRSYRQRQRDAGIQLAKRERASTGNRMPTAWAQGEFVAIDGEGVTEGKPFRVGIPHSGNVYTGQRHYYAFLAASDGSEVYAERGRLSMEQCLDFLCQIKLNNPNAIVVCFGGSYDVTQMVCHDLKLADMRRLIDKKNKRGLEVETSQWQYKLEYRQRKSFVVRRWSKNEKKYMQDKKGLWKLTPHLSLTVWDVWGFFQDSFVGVLNKWLKNHSDYDFITRMKEQRGTFERGKIDEIREYNKAELRCLVSVMELVRDAINELGLKITRWDGAGAIAGAYMKKYNVKQHMKKPSESVFQAARCAYSGGHIEVCKIGYHQGAVHHYDISSAYPDVFRRLVSLKDGEWHHGTMAIPPPGMTCVKIKYEYQYGMPFYPLFFRQNDGTIFYPRKGIGWYWYPEYEVAHLYALQHGYVTFEVLEYWHFVGVQERPFSWVEDGFRQRQQYIAEADKQGVISGPEKIIKLGLNSLYGKSCQQVGWSTDKTGQIKTPGYFQLEWAGYVTSGCRASLMRAAMQKPQAIIGFATDGLFSLEPLDLDCPKQKSLGTWEYKLHDGITMVMPGVYWLHDNGKVKNFSRGFDKQQMSECQFVHDAWKRKQTTVAIKVTRLIGMGTACVSQDFYKMRGCFVSSNRTLRLDGKNSKRCPIMLYRHRPEQGLIDTVPQDHKNAYALLWDDFVSAPYSVAWLDNPSGDYDDPEGEAMDFWEGLDADLAWAG